MPSANRVILRDRNGNTWPVKVDINGDEWSFKEGWPRFYNKNCLKPLDSLFFEYKGGSAPVFDFTILGENGCEKRGAQNFRIKEEYGIEEIDENEFKEENGDDNSDDDQEEEEDACEKGGGKKYFDSFITGSKTTFITSYVVIWV